MASHARRTLSEKTSSSPQQSATLKPNTTLPTPPTTPPTSPEPANNGTADAATRTIPTDAQMLSSSPPPPPPPNHHGSHHRQTASDASIDTHSSHLSRKDYMDSLVPPSPEEMARISQVQLEREKEEKRKGREKDRETRRSMDLSRASLDAQQQIQDHEHKPRHSIGILSGIRHEKSNGAKTHPQHSSVSATAAAAAAAAASPVTGSSSADTLDKAQPGSGENVLMQHAATMIQKTYRGYKTRREMKGLGLDADTRWTHAIREIKFREMVQPRGKDDVPGPSGTDATQEGLDAGADEARRRSNSAKYKWRKVATIAARAAADMDDDPTSDSGSDSDSSLSDPERRKKAHQKREEAKARRRKDARVMGLQYFLEMVDLKHRYGSNLRTYHEEWKKADTNDPFFYWLDYGEGLNIDMAACPRERLDREQVRYLSREERQYYLVQVDREGRLCWAKNGKRIDTTEEWKDSIHGIVPIDDPTPAFSPNTAKPNQDINNHNNRPTPDPPSPSEGGHSTTSPASAASSSELEAARAAKYASPGLDDAKGVKKVTRISASTILNTLLRKSVRKNTWIFVADTSFRLYVGLKDSGAFQHSSFVQGSRISAAGLIKIKQGRLASLSPLSGHYRPPTSNFRAFVRSLKEEGVDTSRVSISKSYAVLVGLELYMKTQQKGKRLLEKVVHRKDKIVHPEVARKREDEARDTSESAEKERLFLERQRAESAGGEERSMRKASKVVRKLGMGSLSAVPDDSHGEASASGSRVEEVVREEAEGKAETQARLDAGERAEAGQVRHAAKAAGGFALDEDKGKMVTNGGT